MAARADNLSHLAPAARLPAAFVFASRVVKIGHSHIQFRREENPTEPPEIRDLSQLADLEIRSGIVRRRSEHQGIELPPRLAHSITASASWPV
jgi:hypothetical protein